MIENLKEWINKPYPQIESNRVKLGLSFTVGLICFIFLLIFRPFGLHAVDNISYIIGFGAAATISLVIMYFILPSIFKGFFDSDKWTIGNEVIFFILVHFLIGVLCYAYNTLIGIPHGVPQHSLPYFLYIVTCVGILPMLFMIYITEKIAFNKQFKLAQSINNRHYQIDDPLQIKQNRTQKRPHITIRSDYQSEEELRLSPDSFLYAQSSNNYCDIYFLDKAKKTNHRLLRISMKQLNAELSILSQIIRVHKSYLVNQRFISNAEGNARSLYLKLQHIDKSIPVSRSFDRSLIINRLP